MRHTPAVTLGFTMTQAGHARGLNCSASRQPQPGALLLGRAHCMGGPIRTRVATVPDGSPGQTWMACAPAAPASAPSSTIAAPPAPPSSAGWNSRRTLPRRRPAAARACSRRAAARAPRDRACLVLLTVVLLTVWLALAAPK